MNRLKQVGTVVGELQLVHEELYRLVLVPGVLECSVVEKCSRWHGLSWALVCFLPVRGANGLSEKSWRGGLDGVHYTGSRRWGRNEPQNRGHVPYTTINPIQVHEPPALLGFLWSPRVFKNSCHLPRLTTVTHGYTVSVVSLGGDNVRTSRLKPLGSWGSAWRPSAKCELTSSPPG